MSDEARAGKATPAISRSADVVRIDFADGYSRAITPRDLWRFFSKVVQDEAGCWIWTGSLDPDGYAQFSIGIRTTRGHRFAYQYFVGRLPEDAVLDHTCRVRKCVNPKHLEAVTARENTMRGDALSAANAVKTHCDNGHPFDEANTYDDPRGFRGCKRCRREAVREYQGRKAGAQ